MDKEKYLHFIASFLIVLVLTIPFYTTSVYATINKVTVKGNDGIEGFARATDSLNFNIQASISDDTITNDQVVLGSDIKFDKCTSLTNNSFECTLRYPSNGTESFEFRLLPFTINLFKDDKTLDDSKSSSVTIDNKAPQVKLSSQSKFSSQQNVVVDYDVTDFACDDSSCSNKCVGIKSIEFYTSDGAFKQTISPTTNECNIKSSISIDPKTFNDGKNSIFAKATDKFNQVSLETSVTFTIDTSGPVLIPDSFAILRKGISLSTFSPTVLNVDVLVNISGSDLNPNSVTADLSALNPSKNLKNIKASCVSVEDDLYLCKWPIELNPKTGGLKTIVINASDTSGNKESSTISKLLSIDDKGPKVESLSTPKTLGAQVLGKSSGNTVIAVFDEATGLSADEIFLHVDGYKVKAKSCSKEASWVCVWDNINFGNNAQISIQSDTTDILGNAVGEDTNVEVTVDTTIPILRNINITHVGGITQAFPGFFKIGDKIAVEANLTEDNDVFATADFSKFISGAVAVAGSCERIQADEHICTWLTDSINLQASDVVTFNFSDNAGNTIIVTKSLKTYGLENATVPDFWSNNVECSPKVIDRGLGPLINQRVFCQVNLQQKSLTKPVSTVFIGAASCSGDTSIIQSIDTFNTEAGSTSPVVKITLKKDELKINKADLSCSFSIFSRIGSSTTITKNPEIENVKINLAFFNLPLGEVSKEIQDKIDEAKEDAEGIWKLIGTLNKLMFYAKKICQIIHIIFNIIVVFYFVYILFKGTEFAACLSGVGNLLGACAAAYKAATGGCTNVEVQASTGEGLMKGLNWACDMVNCKQTILWGPQVQNWINNIPFPYSPGQYVGPKTEVVGDKWYNQEVKIHGQAQGPLSQYMQPISQYMDPNKNLIVATLFACLPGVIYGLDKYRQIKCLYADCLQNAVGKEGLPVTACEDQKAYATCKYVTSELFAVFPWTAVFDHFIGLIKNTISNPFSAFGIVAAVFCKPACDTPAVTGGQFAYHACRGVRLLNLVGTTAQNVKNIIDEGFTIRTDYCSRLEDNNDKDKDKVTKPTTTTKK